MQLNPSEYFTIVRQLPDPNDSATYYVRAVIRDAKSDETIETVDLTDQGSRRFSKPWLVYSKRSEGFYIAITTTVYTDAAYTTKSDLYAEEMETYLIEMRQQHFGGGGGVSYKEIRKIVEEVVNGMRLPEMPKMPDIESIIAKEVDRAILATEAAHKAISGIQVSPKVNVMAPKVDFTPILDAIAEARSSHESSARTSDINLRAITEAAKAVESSVGKFLREIKANHGMQGQQINDSVSAAFEDIKKLVKIFAEPFVSTKMIGHPDMIEKAKKDMAGKIEEIQSRPVATPYDVSAHIREIMKP